MSNSLYPDYNNMGGAPTETVIMSDGVSTYYCSALIGTASALTDKKFKILRKTPNAFGGNTFAAAFFMESTLLEYTITSGRFKNGEAITGTSGTGTILRDTNGISMIIDIITGTFTAGDIITGDVSGAVAELTAVTEGAVMRGGHKYELSAESIAVVSSYTYNL